MRLRSPAAAVVVGLMLAPASFSATKSSVYRIDHVTDGDTVVLRNGQRVRLVQIDTPEVFFGTECYGPQASALTKKLLPPGAKVRLQVEPATDRIDSYGRLLRYVIRAKGPINVNMRLVAVGAAAPYFYEGRRGGTRLVWKHWRNGRGRSTLACGARARERCTTRTAASRRAPRTSRGSSGLNLLEAVQDAPPVDLLDNRRFARLD